MLFADITGSLGWDANCRGTSPQWVDYFEVIHRGIAGGFTHNSFLFEDYYVWVEFESQTLEVSIDFGDCRTLLVFIKKTVPNLDAFEVRNPQFKVPNFSFK